jgi:hypothetical protein
MPTIQELQSDKDFIGATPEEQKQYLAHTDSDFAKASSEEQEAYRAHVTHNPKDLGPNKDLIGGKSGAYEASMPKDIAAQVPMGMIKGAADFAYNAAKDLLIPTAPKMSEEQKAQHPTIAKIQQYTNPKEYLPEHILTPKNAGEQTGSEASQYGLSSLGAIALPEVAEGAGALIRNARIPKGASALGEIEGTSVPRTPKPKPTIGKISTGEAPASAKAAKGSPSQWLQENPSASPDHATAEAHVMDLSKEDFHTLAKARGIPADAYATREVLEEGHSEHPTGRQQMARQIVADMSGEELENVERTARDIENHPDQSSLSKAERSRLLFSELKPQTPSMPRIGTKVKAVSDLSKTTQALIKSLQASPERVLDELEGTDAQIRTRLLKASGEDIARWKGVDAHPVRVVHNAEGDVLDADGRHRIMQAVERGDKTIAVQTTLRDGTTQTLSVDPTTAAKKFGVTAKSLAETDAQQKAYGKR